MRRCMRGCVPGGELGGPQRGVQGLVVQAIGRQVDAIHLLAGGLQRLADGHGHGVQRRDAAADVLQHAVLLALRRRLRCLGEQIVSV